MFVASESVISPLPCWFLLISFTERTEDFHLFELKWRFAWAEQTKNDISLLLIVKKKNLNKEKRQDQGLSLLHAESGNSGIHVLLCCLIGISMFKRCKCTVLVSICRMFLYRLSEGKEEPVSKYVVLRLVWHLILSFQSWVYINKVKSLHLDT